MRLSPHLPLQTLRITIHLSRTPLDKRLFLLRVAEFETAVVDILRDDFPDQIFIEVATIKVPVNHSTKPDPMHVDVLPLVSLVEEFEERPSTENWVGGTENSGRESCQIDHFPS